MRIIACINEPFFQQVVVYLWFEVSPDNAVRLPIWAVSPMQMRCCEWLVARWQDRMMCSASWDFVRLYLRSGLGFPILVLKGIHSKHCDDKLSLMKVYFDVCCLNRPFDDQNQDRIHLEAEAVLTILKYIDAGTWRFVSSDTVIYEINNTRDEERKDRLLSINNRAKTHITVDDAIFERTTIIKEIGFTTYDAMHIACAETAQADVFLSTDKGLINRASRNKNDLFVEIHNPLYWIQKELNS